MARKSLRHFNSPILSIMRGIRGGLFVSFSFIYGLMNILHDIFKDHYEEMIYILHPRTSVIKNVDKIINRGDPDLGGAMYGFPHFGKLKFVPFRCRNCFCPTCSNLYAMQRTTSISFQLVDVSHRHCVFTIDGQLRDFYLNGCSLLDCLFHAVNSVVPRMFFRQNKSLDPTPGFIMVLHTLGRDLKWNPHTHCLISEGGYSDNRSRRNANHLTIHNSVMPFVLPCWAKWKPKLEHPLKR